MTLAQVFFCKFCEISKNTFFTEDHPATASEKPEYLLIKQFVEIFPKSRDCQCVFVRSIPPDVFLGKGVPKICTKFTGEHPCRSVIPIKLLCNWNHTLAWVLLYNGKQNNFIHFKKDQSYQTLLWVSAATVLSKADKISKY